MWLKTQSFAHLPTAVALARAYRAAVTRKRSQTAGLDPCTRGFAALEPSGAGPPRAFGVHPEH